MITAISPERSADDLDDELIHEVCCDENTAVCGADVHGQPWMAVETETTCLLCVLTTRCPVCKRQ
jgi:hypothetical protein